VSQATSPDNQVCAHCREAFSGRRRGAKYCTPLCARRAYSKARQEDGRHRAYKQTQAAKESQRRYLAASRAIRVLRACLICDVPIPARKDRDTRYCSPKCAAWDRHGFPSTPVPSCHPSRSCVVPRGHASRRGRCLRCAEDFTISAPGHVYCSGVCKERARSSRRDARERGSFVSAVSPQQVYARDQWSCHLCGQPLQCDEQVPHPLAPTIDHVIPLARGGTHEPSNVRAAHFLCNSTKRDRIGFVISDALPA
jgi:hypothetical protein